MIEYSASPPAFSAMILGVKRSSPYPFPLHLFKVTMSLGRYRPYGTSWLTRNHGKLIYHFQFEDRRGPAFGTKLKASLTLYGLNEQETVHVMDRFDTTAIDVHVWRLLLGNSPNVLDGDHVVKPNPFVNDHEEHDHPGAQRAGRSRP